MREPSGGRGQVFKLLARKNAAEANGPPCIRRPDVPSVIVHVARADRGWPGELVVTLLSRGDVDGTGAVLRVGTPNSACWRP
jgi:hypothetical protein